MPDEPSGAPNGAEGGSTGASIPFYRDVRVLNGGWGYWGNALTLPVVAGSEPYDEDFEL